ncbi:uncharacterized protein J4E79_004943 [Alternaria viburni]|uniref:uncharacterized protein n=1 Tax=Alternaria viburni TaxID=566460 RepID=UPI0020C4F492|nr:uncharacterized protein J4E79_004943 [Alternaria viburni]KAI4661132.1 hypothetical protein J4E79_004943 [Alternaria viburni]
MYNFFTIMSAGSETGSQWGWLCLAGVLVILAVRYHYAPSSVLFESKAQQNPSMVSAPPAEKIQDGPLPKRLIVCVDGTWGGPDGTFGSPQGNISTVFRAFASVKEGPVTDQVTGKRWQQQRKYFTGLGDKENAMKNLFLGAFGSGLPAEIEKVYEYCCRNTNGPNDEIYFFGFSRGAFTVRAVANLLCYMHVPKDLNDFSKHYQEMLELYPTVRASNNNVGGQTYHHFIRSTTPPVVRFVGAFDTVKAFTDHGLFDVLPHPHIQHYRHALALNEEREQFKPETATPDINAASSKHRILQAWFVGTHEDLGGANSKDGLSLYPLQWVLSEAEALGLTLGFRPIGLEYKETAYIQEPPKPYMDDPVKLVMPPQSQRQKTSSKPSETSLTLENGISVRLWDLCDIHENRKDEFQVKINSSYWGPAHRFVWRIKPRCIFDEHVLMGYCPTSPVGTFIHPSVYQVLDENPSISHVSGGWAFSKSLALFRHRAIPDEGEIFWQNPSPAMQKRLEKVRILICGDAGVGKSSLINKVLKGNLSQVNANTHQKHDVEEEITGPDLPYIVHDSEGFQSGASNKEASAVENFLTTRSKEPKLPLRVHTIWYCILAGPERESRPACESDEDLFKVLNKCKSTIPVVVICSKVDKLRAMYKGEEDEEEYDDQLTYEERRRFVDARVAERVDLFKAKIKEAFVNTSKGYPCMAGPIFTSEKDAESIKNLVEVTSSNLKNDQVRAMFSQAQGVLVDVKVEAAIKESLRLYKHAVRTSTVPLAYSGSVSTTVVAPMIVSAISGIFNFHGISGDIAWRCMANVLVSNTTANVVQLFTQALGSAGAVMVGSGFGAVPGAVLGTGVAAVSIVAAPQFGRALLMCALDTIIILDHAFWQCDNDQKEVEKKDIDKSAEWFNEGPCSKVHEDIMAMIRVWNLLDAFDYERIEKEMNAIVSRYRYQPVVQNVEEHQQPSSPEPAAGNQVVEKSFWQGWFGG